MCAKRSMLFKINRCSMPPKQPSPKTVKILLSAALSFRRYPVSSMPLRHLFLHLHAIAALYYKVHLLSGNVILKSCAQCRGGCLPCHPICPQAPPSCTTSFFLHHCCLSSASI